MKASAGSLSVRTENDFFLLANWYSANLIDTQINAINRV